MSSILDCYICENICTMHGFHCENIFLRFNGGLMVIMFADGSQHKLKIQYKAIL